VICIKRATDARNRITLTSNHPLPERKIPQKISPLPELRNIERVTITTDGSYKSGEMGSAAIFEAENMPPIIKMMKPEQYDASPLKAELQAYYSGLLLCHPGTEVTLRYDCEELKNLVDLFNKPRLTQRIILKTPHYPLVNAIKRRIEEIGSQITYIKIPRVLNEADLPSKTARMSQETAVHMVQHTEQNDFQIIFNGAKTNQYPRKLLKDARQMIITTKNNQKVGNLWAPILTSNINHKVTLQALDMNLDRQNSLDSTLFKCQAFRMTIVHRNIQTLDKRAHFFGSYFENDFCMRCDGKITEDHAHIWECQHTINSEEQIFERGIELFQQAVETKSLICRRESAYRAVTTLGLSPNTILSSPLCSGIITRKATRKGLLMLKSIPGFKMNWLPLLASSLTRAFWEIIWTPRTAQVQKRQAELEAIADEEERQFDIQREQRKKQLLLERGKQKRILLTEMRREKTEFEKRVKERLYEKETKRKEAQCPKTRKRNSTSPLPKPKKRKSGEEEVANQATKGLQPDLRSKPKEGATAYCLGSRKRKPINPEESIPQKKYKPTPAIPEEAAPRLEPRGTRQSSRIKAKESTSNFPTNVP